MNCRHSSVVERVLGKDEVEGSIPSDGSICKACGDELRVVAAAIRDLDGVIFSLPPPGRHCDVIRLMSEKGRVCPPLDRQGFLLSDGTFAMRKSAKVVAERAGQLLPRASRLQELFSEDVW